MPVDSLSGPPTSPNRQSAEKRPVWRLFPLWCLDVPAMCRDRDPAHPV